jgi:hypothetical protein
MVLFAYQTWHIGKNGIAAPNEVVDLRNLSREALLDQVKGRMHHFWESRMQRLYSFLGMPMRAKGADREQVLATYRSYKAAGGEKAEVSLLITEICWHIVRTFMIML